MVTKTRRTNKGPAQGYILTISAHSRSYPTMKAATAAAKKVLNTKSGKLAGVVTKPRKLKTGYKFTLRSFFSAKNMSEAKTSAARAKRAVPGVITKIEKV